jgi:hypothetical protein
VSAVYACWVIELDWSVPQLRLTLIPVERREMSPVFPPSKARCSKGPVTQHHEPPKIFVYFLMTHEIASTSDFSFQEKSFTCHRAKLSMCWWETEGSQVRQCIFPPPSAFSLRKRWLLSIAAALIWKFWLVWRAQFVSALVKRLKGSAASLIYISNSCVGSQSAAKDCFYGNIKEQQ